jgi:hypothetical protein
MANDQAISVKPAEPDAQRDRAGSATRDEARVVQGDTAACRALMARLMPIVQRRAVRALGKSGRWNSCSRQELLDRVHDVFVLLALVVEEQEPTEVAKRFALSANALYSFRSPPKPAPRKRRIRRLARGSRGLRWFEQAHTGSVRVRSLRQFRALARVWPLAQAEVTSIRQGRCGQRGRGSRSRALCSRSREQ